MYTHKACTVCYVVHILTCVYYSRQSMYILYMYVHTACNVLYVNGELVLRCLTRYRAGCDDAFDRSAYGAVVTATLLPVHDDLPR